MLEILIIEDDQKKLRKISKALCTIDGITAKSINHVIDVASAKKQLRNNYFDLLILDIVIPLRIDTAIKKDAGLNLLREVIERDLYHIPEHIIGVTQHKEIFSEIEKEFKKDLITFIQYTPDNSLALKQLIRKVSIVVASKFRSQNRITGYSSHASIICATENPEWKGLMQNGWKWEKISIPNDTSNYYQTILEKDNQTHIIHAACTPRMGMTAAAIMATKMIIGFRPKYLIMPGITAGYIGDTNLGDVIIGNPVWDWGAGKWIQKGSNLEFLQEPHQLPLDASIRDKFVEMSRNHQLLYDIRKKWKGKSPDHDLRILIGPVASGAAVISDEETCESIKKQHRKLLGIEMESYAIYSAAFESMLPKPVAFTAKSVVDFANGQKDDSFHEYSAYASAEIVREFIENYL